MAIKERWGKRELERQFRLAAFETAAMKPPKLSPTVREIHGEAATGVFKDAFTAEFLNLPEDHSEADLHRGLIGQLRAFLTELGRDCCYVGSEFPLQVAAGISPLTYCSLAGSKTRGRLAAAASILRPSAYPGSPPVLLTPSGSEIRNSG